MVIQSTLKSMIIKKKWLDDLIKQLKNIRKDLIKDKLKQSRIISAEMEYKKKNIQIINIYTPNGNPVDTEKYDYKKKMAR